MCTDDAIPESVRSAFELLRSERTDITVTDPLRRSGGRDSFSTEFKCILRAPANSEGIPESVDFRVVLDDAFPYAPVEVYPLCDDVRGFPHQDASTGKLCLKEVRQAPNDLSRLVVYVEWAEEWLADACAGLLLKPGDPYELPDFSVQDSPSRFRYNGLFLFEESAGTFSQWAGLVGQAGSVRMVARTLPEALAAIEFLGRSNTAISRSGIQLGQDKPDAWVKGSWALVADIRFKRNRPPQNMQEIEAVLQENGVDADTLFRNAWKDGGGKCGVSIVVIGWPIPREVGGAPVRIEWKAMAFRCYDASKTALAKEMGISKKKARPVDMWPHFKKKSFDPLPWISGQNLAAEELHARWMLGAGIRESIVGIIGCGALGSVVADFLVRGGVDRLRLYDKDLLEYGNLSRHVLTGWDVRKGKASALATRAKSINPMADVKGFGVRIPLEGKGGEYDKVADSLDECELYIDCSTSNDAAAWVSQKARNERKRVALIFIDYRAEHLTLCVSGRNTACSKVERDLYADVEQGLTPIDRQCYRGPTESEGPFIPSPGCWHPTFPAAWHDIQALVACAVRELDVIIGQPERCSGVGVIWRRNDGEAAARRGVIEVAWRKEYR